MKVRYLIDENEPPRLKVALLRLRPAIDVLRVGDPGAPAYGSPDPDVLRFLELAQRILVTSNRRSMPDHITDHWSAGGHLWGPFWICPRTPVSRLADELCFVWDASEAEEWIDQLRWIPL